MIFRQLVFCAIILALSNGPAWAELVGLDRLPPPLATLVTNSDVVAVVRVSEIATVRNPREQNDYDPPIVNGGSYSLALFRTIKGSMPAEVTITFPSLYGFPYDYSLQQPKSGDYLLVFLQQTATGFIATSHVTPYYPIAQPNVSDWTPESDPVDEAASVMADSLPDTGRRRLISYFMKETVSPFAVLAMAKYVNDPDIEVKCNAFGCMEFNGQVAAIPMIARLADKLALSGQQSNATIYLAYFTSPNAVAYLNPLLWDSVVSVRSFAINALYSNADSSSAPYLILALRDPEPGYEMSGAARNILAARILKLPQPYEDEDVYAANYTTELKQYGDWWSAELSGAHLPTDSQSVALQGIEASQAIPADTASINRLLFEPYPALRERAVRVLSSKADHSSIPYLVLALQDPDQTVSYFAYVILRRLVGFTVGPLAMSDYVSNQDAADRPLYTWWSDELLGEHRHVQIPVPSSLNP